MKTTTFTRQRSGLLMQKAVLQHIKLLVFFGLIFATITGCQKENSSHQSSNTQAQGRPLKSLSTTSIATAFNNYFTMSTAGNWVGGDVDYCVPLPDGRQLWCFGDSFLGPVNPPRVLPPQSQSLLFGTTLLTQNTNGTSNTIYGSSGGFPVSYFGTGVSGEYYWPKDGIYYNNKVYIFLYKWQSNGTGFPTFLGTGLAILNYPALTVQSVTDLNTGSGATLFGSSLMLSGTTLYIYGSEDNGATKYMHVAKVDITNIANPALWQHYKGGTTWSTGYTSSARIFTNNSNEFTVFQSGSSYYLINQLTTNFSPNIYRYKSTSPAGPWGSELLVYTAPYGGTGTWTYDAKAHIQFKNGSPTNTDILISYDVNVNPISNAYSNVDLYRPYFIWLSGWQ